MSRAKSGGTKRLVSFKDEDVDDDEASKTKKKTRHGELQGVRLVPASEVAEDERPSYREAVSRTEGAEEEDAMLMEVKRPEFKAVHRFLFLLSQSIPGLRLDNILSVSRMCRLDRAIVNEEHVLDLEVDLHCFVDFVNFCIVRWMAQLRTCPALRAMRLLDVLNNMTACSAFIGLVTRTWNNTKLDICEFFQNEKVRAFGDKYESELHWRYFVELRQVPRPDIDFEKVVLRSYEGYSEDRERSLLTDADLFTTPAHPLKFLIRVALQAVHQHRVDALRRVLDNVDAPKPVGVSGRVDDVAQGKMQGGVFLGDHAGGFTDGMIEVFAATHGTITHNDVIRGIADTTASLAARLARTGFLANLVFLCTCRRRIMGMKCNARAAVITRLDTQIKHEIPFIRYAYSGLA